MWTKRKRTLKEDNETTSLFFISFVNFDFSLYLQPTAPHFFFPSLSLHSFIQPKLPTQTANIMLPRNAIAIRKTLGAAKTAEIITAVTHKTSTATLLDYPPGAYTGMRTFGRLGIMDFPGHTTRLANSLQQIRFPSQDPAKDNNTESAAATQELAAWRRPDVMKEETTSLVKAGLKFYYNSYSDTLGPTDETKVTVLCTWDPKV